MYAKYIVQKLSKYFSKRKLINIAAKIAVMFLQYHLADAKQNIATICAGRLVFKIQKISALFHKLMEVIRDVVKTTIAILSNKIHKVIMQMRTFVWLN